MFNYILYFDGGCWPSGNGKGYGSYEIRDNDNNVIDCKLRIQFGNNLTSNQAEYLSLIEGLKYLINNHKEVQLKIYSDSNLVVNQVNRAWKCKNNRLKELRAEVLKLLDLFNRWEIKWHGRENNLEKFGH